MLQAFGRAFMIHQILFRLLIFVQRIKNQCSLEPACRTKGHSILDVGCLPNEPSPQTMIISKHHSQRSTFHMFHHHPLELGAFFMNRGYDWSRECWKSFEKRKQKVSCAAMEQTSQETRPGSDSTFHTISGQQ